MSLRAKAQQQVESAATIKVLEQRGNHAQSMDILAKNGLRPLTYQEALSRSSELIEKLKGKWFYLDGKGIAGSGIYTFNENGALVAPKGNEALDQKVRVWSGSNPLSLFVNSDNVARYLGRRFYLGGGDLPYGVAPVVVGVEVGRKAAAPKNVVHGVVVPEEKFNAAQATVRTLVASGVVDQEILKPLIEVFRD